MKKFKRSQTSSKLKFNSNEIETKKIKSIDEKFEETIRKIANFLKQNDDNLNLNLPKLKEKKKETPFFKKKDPKIKVDYNNEIFSLDIINYIKIIELLNACKSDNETDAVMILNSIIKEGKEVPRIVNDTVLFLRDLLLFKNNAIVEDKLMYQNEEFKKLANNISRNLIYQWLDILNEASNHNGITYTYTITKIFDVIKFLNWIYNDAQMYLIRKYIKYKSA